MMRITGAESDEITEIRGAQWWKMLCMRVATLKMVRNVTGNNWSFCRAGVMWSCRLRPRISRATAFWTRWRGDKVDAGSPTITELQ